MSVNFCNYNANLVLPGLRFKHENIVLKPNRRRSFKTLNSLSGNNDRNKPVVILPVRFRQFRNYLPKHLIFIHRDLVTALLTMKTYRSNSVDWVYHQLQLKSHDQIGWEMLLDLWIQTTGREPSNQGLFLTGRLTLILLFLSFMLSNPKVRYLERVENAIKLAKDRGSGNKVDIFASYQVFGLLLKSWSGNLSFQIVLFILSWNSFFWADSSKVSLIGHSAGGWLARLFLYEFGTEDVELLVTLGTPHLWVWLIIFPKWKNKKKLLFRPPPQGIQGVVDQTRGLLYHIEENFPGAFHSEVKYVCVAGR